MRYYVVNAFTDSLFSGNPAGICLPEQVLEEALMQRIAKENGLSETAFVHKDTNGYSIRWFTPLAEVDLCGHATLGSAFVLAHFVEPKAHSFAFSSRSGVLTVTRAADIFELNFPVREQRTVPVTDLMRQAIGLPVRAAYEGHKLTLELENEEAVRSARPDLAIISTLSKEGVVITAAGTTVDFVSRLFAPQRGINEDPVTGATHTTLIPLWSKRLGKNELTAAQLSERGGLLRCKLAGDRVIIGGKARLYLSGELHL